MRASPTHEITARTICRRIKAKQDVLPSDSVDGEKAVDLLSGLSLAIERGWLARRENGYVLTHEGYEIAHRSGSKAVNFNSIGFGLR